MNQRRCNGLLIAAILIAFPILSFAASASDKASLHRHVLGQIQQPPYAKASWGILAFDLASKEVLFDLNADQPMIPASNRKLFTTAFALERLGSGFRFETQVLRRGQVSGGVLHGDLIVKASGDPSLTATGAFDSLATRIQQMGIRSVQGNLIVDASCFREQSFLGEGWASRYLSDYYAARPSAFAVNKNAVSVSVTPTSSGSAGSVTLSPSGSSLRIINHTRSASKGESGIDVDAGSDGRSLIVSGSVTRAAGMEVLRAAVPDPERFALDVFKDCLKKKGIILSGSAMVSTAPMNDASLVLVAAHESSSLSELLKEMNQESDNFMAEMIYLAAGRGNGPVAASYELSRAQEALFWARCGLSDAAVLHASDGSGLSKMNRCTARSFCELLRFMLNHPERETFTHSLAVSGKAGTLKSRLDDPQYRSRVVGKTGYISQVSCLSGYVIDRQNQTQIFSIMVNDFDCSLSSVKSVQDRICRWLIDLPASVETAMTK